VNVSLDSAECRTLRRKARTSTLEALGALGGEANRDAIRDWALAHGGFTARELAAPPPEAAGGKYRNAVRHQLSWTLTNLKREGLVENPKWSMWRLTAAGRPPVPSAVEKGPDARRLAELRAMSHRRYLQTPEWRRTRAAALLRAGNSCSLDAAHTERLEVHHSTYARVGAELVTDLVVLCRSCHELHHKEFGRPRREQSMDPPQSPRTENVQVSAAAPGKLERSGKMSLLRRLLAS
jgi:5-methylcytosine-specific restriction endonuclease McrA